MGTTKDQLKLTALCNKLFMYTDQQQWDRLQEEVFAPQVWFDMTSAGGVAKEMKAAEICELWQQGFAGLDAVHHQAGQYLFSIQGSTADILAYAVAWHYKVSASQGKSRMFVGSYDLKAAKDGKYWRLNQFRYDLKFIEGNESLA